MTPADLAFFVLAAVLLASALGVVFTRNPVHAVLLLVLTFFNAAGVFILLGAEFLAMLLIIVYVGAVMVLFLFVVMMLRVDPAKMRAQGRAALPLGLLVAGVLMAEMAAVALSFAALPGAASPAFALPEGVTDARALGRVLYTDFVYPFQVAGLILLIAMVGAIALTQRARPDIKRQSVADQTARRPGDAMEIVKVTPRTGA